ncbi:MAG: putative molybdenum carrier protein, partial [Akkermansiaceae bacterium]|nr:putative molybdenum carrier protein [Akkermansiaceae bacterium]
SLAGPIPEHFQLKETPSSDYLQRTEWNARDSDGTVIFTLAAHATGGSLKTIEFAKQHGKPWLHLARAEPGLGSFAERLRAFIEEYRIEKLNVAGSRESKEPGIHDWTREVLEQALFPQA